METKGIKKAEVCSWPSKSLLSLSTTLKGESVFTFIKQIVYCKKSVCVCVHVCVYTYYMSS